jgi:hypothetical protein
LQVSLNTWRAQRYGGSPFSQKKKKKNKRAVY